MKCCRYLMIPALMLLCFSSAVLAKPSEDKINALTVLQQMETANQTLSYQLSYILIKKQAIEPLRYQHAILDGKPYAHLMYLSGAPREVIQRGKEISYFEQGLTPFTIDSRHMVGALPPMLNTDIEQLVPYYDFISMGQAREAGALCNVVRVVPKDGKRYSYLLWIDVKNNLLLRANLLDRDGESLEQYLAVSFDVTPKITQSLLQLNSVSLPPVMPLPTQSLTLNWKTNWLPRGFVNISQSRHRLMNTEQLVESQIYSDGLFHFSIYVSPPSAVNIETQLLRQGRRSLATVKINKQEVTVIGDIPPNTARRIAESVVFDSNVLTKPSSNAS